MDNKIKILWVIPVLFLFVVAGCSTHRYQKVNENIKIGVAMPLTGNAAVYGIESQEALELAKDEINSNGGINGRNITLIYEDTKCDSKEATLVAHRLIDIDKTKIIIGAACSGATLAMAPITEENKVILFSPISTSPDITNAGEYVFRNSPSDDLGAKKIADYLYKHKYYKVAIINEQTDFSEAMAKAFKNEFTKLGGKIVAEEKFAKDSTDMRAQLLKIKESDAEVVFFIPQTPSTGAILLKQAREIGLNKTIVGNEFYHTKELLDSVGNAANGVLLFVAASPNGEKTTEFYNKFKKRYGKEVDIKEYTPNSYDALYIISDAIKRNGLDTGKIRDYILSIKDYNGAGGVYSFDKNGDVDKDYLLMKVINNTAIEIGKLD